MADDKTDIDKNAAAKRVMKKAVDWADSGFSRSAKLHRNLGKERGIREQYIPMDDGGLKVNSEPDPEFKPQVEPEIVGAWARFKAFFVPRELKGRDTRIKISYPEPEEAEVISRNPLPGHMGPSKPTIFSGGDLDSHTQPKTEDSSPLQANFVSKPPTPPEPKRPSTKQMEALLEKYGQKERDGKNPNDRGGR